METVTQPENEVKAVPVPRASAMPMVQRCPASWQASLAAPSISGPEAVEGRMIHEIAAIMVRTGEGLSPEDVDALAMRYGVEASEIENAQDRLDWLRGNRPWGKAQTEVEISAPIPGHLDVLWLSPDHALAEVWDFKTGRLEVDPPRRNAQMIAYAAGVRRRYPQVEQVKVCVIYTQLWDTDEATFTWQELARASEWLQVIADEATSARPEFRPGAHCAYCAGRNACPALHREVAVFAADSPTQSFADLVPARKAQALATAKALKGLIADLESQAKRWVDEHGPIDMGNGEEFAAVEQSNREIDPEKGWGALCAACGDRMAEAVTVGVGAAEEAAIANAQDSAGGAKVVKAKVRRDLMAALEAAGALTKKPVTKYQIVKRKEKIENGQAA